MKESYKEHDLDCDDSACGLFECDVCVSEVPKCRVVRVTAYGIETYACDVCRGSVWERTNAP